MRESSIISSHIACEPLSLIIYKLPYNNVVWFIASKYKSAIQCYFEVHSIWNSEIYFNIVPDYIIEPGVKCWILWCVPCIQRNKMLFSFIAKMLLIISTPCLSLMAILIDFIHFKWDLHGLWRKWKGGAREKWFDLMQSIYLFYCIKQSPSLHPYKMFTHHHHRQTDVHPLFL